MYKVYVLLCSDNSLYTGITKDIKNRMKVHRSGNGSKYVYSRLPFELVYTEKCTNRSKTSKREYEIKSWSREEKIDNLGIEI